jgi:hypothetical protein
MIFYGVAAFAFATSKPEPAEATTVDAAASHLRLEREFCSVVFMIRDVWILNQCRCNG